MDPTNPFPDDPEYAGPPENSVGKVFFSLYDRATATKRPRPFTLISGGKDRAPPFWRFPQLVRE